MADISFNEPKYSSATRTKGPTGLMGLAIRSGLARDERSAQIVLLVVAALFFAAAIGVYLMQNTSDAGTNIPDPNTTIHS